MILDTGIWDAVDDAFALAYATLHPDIELLAVTTIWNDTRCRAALALAVLDAIGIFRVPVAAGSGENDGAASARPLARMSGDVLVPLGEAHPGTDTRHAVDLIRDTASDAAVPVWLATNAATALDRSLCSAWSPARRRPRTHPSHCPPQAQWGTQTRHRAYPACSRAPRKASPLNISKRVQGLAESGTIAVSNKIAEMRSEGIDVISLGAGEPDFDTPEHIKQAAINAIARGETKYAKPASGVPELKNAVVGKLRRQNGLNYDVSQVLATIGGKEALWLTFATILDPGDEVIIPAPSWVSYPEQVKQRIQTNP